MKVVFSARIGEVDHGGGLDTTKFKVGVRRIMRYGRDVN